MSVESLKKRSDVAWVDEKSVEEGGFGPPIFEEKSSSYKWRIFKRGFSWGFILTAVAMTQYSALSYFLKPQAKSLSVFILMPITYGVAIGTVFGVYENICYPKLHVKGYLEQLNQVKIKPKSESKV